MRFAIVGSGAVGGYFGAKLARNGQEVTFIARGANLEALRTRGLTVKPWQRPAFHVGARATDDPREIGPVDLVWFCVKTYDVDQAARQIVPLVGPETAILPVL